MEIKHVSLKDYSSLRIGGMGDMIAVRSAKELVNAVMHGRQEGKVVHILGEGTNTYFGDNLSKYLFIKNEIKGISFEEKGDFVLLTVGAGEIWDTIVSFSVDKGLWGIENLSSIPGTAGAAPVQNIGAYGTELKDVLVSLSAYDTKTSNTVEISNSGCMFGYRDSLFKQEKNRYIIISITLSLSKKAKPILTYKPLDTLLTKESITVGDIRTLVISTRKVKLPDYKEYPNVGSFFKNSIVTSTQSSALRAIYPDIPLIPHYDEFKITSAWLIEHVAKMKGVRIGDVGTWPLQPLVIVNYGNATSEDIFLFSQNIIEKIEKETGVLLEREANCVD
jgi:UDP-N-acetylmuramate dehydrogenase